MGKYEVNKRIDWVDFLKGLGILLVLLGHFTEPFIGEYKILKVLFVFIYSFHMPLFCLLSGLVIKRIKLDKIKKYILIYLFSQVIYAIFRILFLNYNFSLKSFIIGILFPFWHLWYLEALIIWNISLILIQKMNINKFVAFILSIILSLVSGYIAVPLSLQRSISFYPFFLFGYLYKDFILRKVDNRNNKILFVNTFIIALIFLLKVYFLDSINLESLFEYASYKVGNYSIEDRLIFTILGLYLSYAISLLAAIHRSKKITRLSEYSFSIYIFHALVFFTLKQLNVHQYILDTNNLMITVLYILICIISCVFIFSNHIFNNLLNKIGTIFFLKN